MSQKSQRQILIEDCLDKKLSRFETNKILFQNNFDELKNGEADCYDVVLNSITTSNPRKKIIASCLVQGFSKTDVNLTLYDNKFRKLTEEEAAEYDDIISRIRYCGVGITKNFENKISKTLTEDEIIDAAIVSENSISELNKKLADNGFAPMNDIKQNEYRKRYNEYHNKRQSIIQHSFENCLSVADVNKKLKSENLSTLSIVEEMNYQKERERIQEKKRQNLLKECLEEHLEIYEINILLMNNGFEKLSEQEEDKLRSEINSRGMKKDKKKTTELSEQFRALYRQATKEFHPDKFNKPEQMAKATKVMMELNNAKDQNDYFLLKEIVAKYKSEFDVN